jgi:hypothetical protein
VVNSWLVSIIVPVCAKKLVACGAVALHLKQYDRFPEKILTARQGCAVFAQFRTHFNLTKNYVGRGADKKDAS